VRNKEAEKPEQQSSATTEHRNFGTGGRSYTTRPNGIAELAPPTVLLCAYCLLRTPYFEEAAFRPRLKAS
jgi:hypothetical protein